MSENIKVTRDEVVEKLQILSDTKHFFSEYFGTSIYDGFDDMRYVKSWRCDGDEIGWVESEDYNDEDGEYPDEYNGEIWGTAIWEKEDFTLVRYDNGCGEKIYAVFDNKTKVNIE
jgi:hypothetical protein